ncbi:MAG: hypothetical protein NC417_04100 [Candidatus Gastranaerophilales bacterium]|nr:hypothetical protein [Candidatus Gastranaerophilales bacterium]
MYWAEMRKIWRLKTLLFMIVFSVLFFASFLYQWMKPFVRMEEGIGGVDSLHEKIEILSAWIEQYGNTIDETEFREIENDYQNILRQAGSIIEEDDFFRENGVEDYEAYLHYGQKAVGGEDGYDYSVYSKMRSLILQNTEYSSIYLEQYESILQQYRKSGEVRSSVLPFEVFVYTNNYLVNLAVLCLICVFFVAAFVMADDRENHVVDAQYSSKTGKRIYRIQYTCMMISAVIAVSMVVIPAMLLWRSTGNFVFAKSDSSSFLNTENFVVSVTYRKYILFFLVMIYFLTLGVGSVIFYLSAHSSNMISMMLKTIPVLAAGCGMALILRDAFCESSLFFGLSGWKYCEVFAAAMVLLAGVLLNVGNYNEIWKRDA